MAAGNKKCFGYLRVSSQGQVGGDGLVRQEETIRQYAQAQGYEIVDWYKDEGVSGTIESRPALAAMLVNLEQNGHGIQTIIIEKLDRLARDLMVQEAIINDFRKGGFKLLSAHEGPDLAADDPTRKLVRQVMGAIAEYEKTMIVLKLKAARDRKKAKTGKCEGRKGYAEAMPDVIDLIKQLRRKPQTGRRRTWQQIADELNRQGKTTISGKPWSMQNVVDAMR